MLRSHLFGSGKKEGIVQMKNEESHSSKGTKILVGLPTYRILIPVTTHCSVIQHAKYLVFVSICSLKMRELSFAQFVYFIIQNQESVPAWISSIWSRYKM